MNRFGRITHFILLSVLFTLALSTTAFSQTSRERNAKKSRAAAAQSDKAARVFSQIMATRERSIPRDLLDMTATANPEPRELSWSSMLLAYARRRRRFM